MFQGLIISDLKGEDCTLNKPFCVCMAAGRNESIRCLAWAVRMAPRGCYHADAPAQNLSRKRVEPVPRRQATPPTKQATFPGGLGAVPGGLSVQITEMKRKHRDMCGGHSPATGVDRDREAETGDPTAGGRIARAGWRGRAGGGHSSGVTQAHCSHMALCCDSDSVAIAPAD